jgi:triphosphatase
VSPVARAPRGCVLSADDGAAVAARAVVRFQLGAFARNEGPARAGEAEAVHQLRVATRRLRAALRLFQPVVPGRFAEAAQRDIGWLAQAIGGVRDLDVLGEAVTARAARLAPGLRTGLGPVALAVHDQRAAAHAALTAALDASRCRRLLDRLAGFADGTGSPARDRRLGDVAADLVRPLFRPVLRAGRRLDDDSPPEAFHRLRVRVKRLRYALETLRGLGGERTARLLARLERLQAVLGDQQDAVTEVAWLRSWVAAAAPAPATTLAVGAVIHLLLARAEKRRARVADAWRRVDRAKLVAGTIDELAHDARAVREAS